MNTELQKCVIYARVSSKEQEETGYSLPAQLDLLRKYAEKNGFKVCKEFSIAESATSQSGRKTFQAMLTYTNQKKIHTIICEKIDRLTRTPKDAGVIDDWVRSTETRTVHFAKEGFILSKQTKAHENLVWNMKVAIAKFYTDNLSEEVRKGQAAKIAAGHLPTKPPLGYRTVGEQGKKVHVIDDNTAPLVKKMFEMYATGNFSVVELTKRINLTGLRNRNGNKLSKTRVHDFLSDPFYYGDMRWNDKIYKGAHEPLITLELFNKVQEKLGRGTASPYYRTHPMLYKAKVTCATCGFLVSWERQKGHVYGSCKHCKSPLGASSKYLREEELDKKIIEKVLEVAPKNQKVLDILNQALKEDAEEEMHAYETSKRQLEENLRRGDLRVDTAYTDRLDGRIGTERYDGIKAEWDAERKAILNELTRLSNDKSKYYDAGFSIHVLATKTREIYESRHVTDDDRRLLLSYAFNKVTLERGNIEVEYTPAFEYLQKWVPAVNQSFELEISGSNKRRKAPFGTSHPSLLRRQDSNLRPID